MDRIKDLLRKILNAQGNEILFAYLFGSRAANESTYPPRDIDLAVYFQPTGIPPFDAKLELHGTLSRALRTNDIDILVLNNAQNLVLLSEIIRKGVVLIDRDPDFREEFEQGIIHQAIDFKSQRISLIGF